MKKKKKKSNIDEFLEKKEGTQPKTKDYSEYKFVYYSGTEPVSEQTFADFMGLDDYRIQYTPIYKLKSSFFAYDLPKRVHMTHQDIQAMSENIFRSLLKQPIAKVGAAMKEMGKGGSDEEIKKALAALGQGEGEEKEEKPKKKEKTPEQKEAEKKADEDLIKQLRAAMSQSTLKEEEIKEFSEQMKKESKEEKEDKALEDFQDLIKEKAQERVKEMIAEALAPIQMPQESSHVKGQHYKYPLVLKCIQCNDVNVALVGPAGSGKTRLVEEVAKTLELHFSPQSFNCLSSKADILGFVDAGGTYHASVFRERFEYGGVFLADEFDACHPGVATILNAAIANKLCTFGDNKTVKAHPNFKAVMCMNTFGTGPNAEYVGRNRLDAATLDRFAFIYLDYDESLEFHMIGVEQPPKEFFLAAGGVSNAAAWILEVQKIREIIKTNKMRMIVSPRATIMGSELSAVGVGLEHLRELLIFKGISENDREQLVELMKPPAPKKNYEISDADVIAEKQLIQLQRQAAELAAQKQRVLGYDPAIALQEPARGIIGGLGKWR